MFRISILNKFLLRRFLSGVGLVIFVVGGIILAVTFVERLPSNPTAFDAFVESWMRLLEYIPMFLPPAIFMGTLLASYNMIKSSESVIISGAGRSPYQMARPFFVGAALIGIFTTTVINPYSVDMNAQKITSSHLKLVDNSIWLRDAGDKNYITMNAGGGLSHIGDTLVFNDVTIYIQDEHFKITERVNAANVSLTQSGLRASNANVWGTDGVLSKHDWQIQTRLTPQTVLDRYLQPDQISFWKLPGFIHKMQSVGVIVRAHQVQFWTLLFLPLTMIAMTVLGVAFSQTRQRRNYNFGAKFALGILTCFALYFVVNMFNALGATGALPPILAIVAPSLIIIAASGVYIAGFDTV